jgi:hypothetical protein
MILLNLKKPSPSISGGGRGGFGFVEMPNKDEAENEQPCAHQLCVDYCRLGGLMGVNRQPVPGDMRRRGPLGDEGQLQVVDDAVDHGLVGEEGNDAHLPQ